MKAPTTEKTTRCAATRGCVVMTLDISHGPSSGVDRSGIDNGTARRAMEHDVDSRHELLHHKVMGQGLSSGAQDKDGSTPDPGVMEHPGWFPGVLGYREGSLRPQAFRLRRRGEIRLSRWRRAAKPLKQRGGVHARRRGQAAITQAWWERGGGLNRRPKSKGRRQFLKIRGVGRPQLPPTTGRRRGSMRCCLAREETSRLPRGTCMASQGGGYGYHKSARRTIPWGELLLLRRKT